MIIAEIPKNRREVIRVECSEYQGHKLANVRVWFRTEDDELRPSKKGVSIKLQHAEEVAKALLEAAAWEATE